MDESKEEIEKSKQGLIILSIIIISGTISAYASNLYFDYNQILSLSPLIGFIISQLLIVRIIEIPKKRSKKDDLFIIALTIITWFIAYTLILNI